MSGFIADLTNVSKCKSTSAANSSKFSQAGSGPVEIANQPVVLEPCTSSSSFSDQFSVNSYSGNPNFNQAIMNSAYLYDDVHPNDIPYWLNSSYSNQLYSD